MFTGRVNIRFSSSKALAQLNEYGVFHLSSLLLCCASHYCDYNTTNPHQVAKDLLKVSQEGLQTLTSSSTAIFLTVLKSSLAQCLLNVSQGTDLNICHLGDEISLSISAVITKFEASQSDMGWKRLSQDVVKVFVKGLTDMSSNLTTGEAALIGEWVGRYLRCCSDNEISSVLEVHSSLLTQARIALGHLPAPAQATLEQLEDIEKIKAVIDQLWRIIFPAVKDLSSSLTSPHTVASLAADFIIQRAESLECRDSSASAPAPDLQEMVRHFTGSRQVPDHISWRVLARICQNSAVSSQVSQDTLLYNIALASAVALPGSEDLEAMRGAWRQVSGDQEDLGGLEDTARQIIVLSTDNQRLISSLCSLASHPTAWKGEAKTARQYQIASWLVFHCTEQLVTKSGREGNLLPSLLNNTLTPNDAFSSSWNLSLHQKKAIAQSLPTFLQGLLSLPNIQFDKFLLRKIKEILRIYLPQFSQPHPLNGLLANPPLIADQVISGFTQQLAISVLNEVILDNRFKSPSVSASCLG